MGRCRFVPEEPGVNNVWKRYIEDDGDVIQADLARGPEHSRTTRRRGADWCVKPYRGEPRAHRRTLATPKDIEAAPGEAVGETQKS